MTAIVGVRDKSGVCLGADSLAIAGMAAFDLAQPKVFLNGQYLIGVAGSPRVAQILEHSFKLDDDSRVKSAAAFMVDRFVPEFRKALASGGHELVEDQVDEMPQWSWALIAFRGRLFSIASSFAVIERREPFDAIGCGSDYALGSLHETASSKLPARNRVKRALECAERFSAGVRRPFTIISQ